MEGTNPQWSADGRELFYRNRAKMMAVAVESGRVVGTAKVLFEKSGPAAYDVGADGRFLMLKPEVAVTPDKAAEIHVVVNWFEKLRGKVGK